MYNRAQVSTESSRLLGQLQLTCPSVSHDGIQKVCRCLSCSQAPLGYRSVSYFVWRQHNDPGHRYFRPAPAPANYFTQGPLQERAAPSTDNVPLLTPPVSVRTNSDKPGTSSPALTADLDMDMEDYPEFPDFGSEDSSIGGHGQFGHPLSISDATPPPVLHDYSDFDGTDTVDDFEQQRSDIIDRLDNNGEDDYPIIPSEFVLRHHDLSPAQRNIYTAIAFAKIKGTADRATQKMLDQMVASVGIAFDTAHHPDERELAADLDDSTGGSVNYRTAMSRLGVSPEDFIHRYICCPNCWSLTPRIELYALWTPLCGKAYGGQPCQGKLYDQNNSIRTPFKVAPYTKLSEWIATLLQDPKVRESLQHWRQPCDNIGENPAASVGDMVDKDTKMKGFADAAAWRTRLKGTARVVWDDNQAEDRPIDGQQARRLVDSEFGLHIILNIDW
jgi:hypothetical protein